MVSALLLAAIAMQPPPPPGRPRTEPVSAASWTCEIRDLQGRLYRVRGAFDEIDPAGRRMSMGRITEDASGTFVVGQYHGGLMNRGDRVRFYSLAVAGVPPGDGRRNYYHFFLRLYPDEPGVVMIEQQLIDRQPEVFRGFGAGTCHSQFAAGAGGSR